MKKTIIFKLLIVSLILISGCYNQIPPEMYSPLSSTLTLSKKPLLNQPITIIMTFKCEIDAPNTSAKINLPKGFEFISGNLEWEGDLKANEQKTMQANIKSTKQGYYEISAEANSQRERGRYGTSSVIFVEVSKDNAFIGNKFKNKWGGGAALIMSKNNKNINSELSIIGDVGLSKEFKIIYKFASNRDFTGIREKQINLNFPSNAFEIKNVNFPSNCDYQNQFDNQISCLIKEIKKDAPIEISANFKPINEGEMYLSGSLSLQTDDTTDFIQDSKIIWMHVDRYNSYYELTR